MARLDLQSFYHSGTHTIGGLVSARAGVLVIEPFNLSVSLWFSDYTDCVVLGSVSYTAVVLSVVHRRVAEN